MAAAKKSSTKKSASPARAPRATTSTKGEKENKKTASTGSGSTKVKNTKNTKAATKNKNTGPENKKNTRSSTKVATPAKKKTEGKGRGGVNREMDELTGFAVGTDSHVIAQTLLEGGESRQAVIDGLRDTLDTETRNGTEKPVANLVSGVVNKLLARGFTIESSYRLIEPTPASKRAATRAANKTAAPAPKKAAAKKTAAKGKTRTKK